LAQATMVQDVTHTKITVTQKEDGEIDVIKIVVSIEAD
jgi:hypothetical protein